MFFQNLIFPISFVFLWLQQVTCCVVFLIVVYSRPKGLRPVRRSSDDVLPKANPKPVGAPRKPSGPRAPGGKVIDSNRRGGAGAGGGGVAGARRGGGGPGAVSGARKVTGRDKVIVLQVFLLHKMKLG